MMRAFTVLNAQARALFRREGAVFWAPRRPGYAENASAAGRQRALRGTRGEGEEHQ